MRGGKGLREGACAFINPLLQTEKISSLQTIYVPFSKENLSR